MDWYFYLIVDLQRFMFCSASYSVAYELLNPLSYGIKICCSVDFGAVALSRLCTRYPFSYLATDASFSTDT